MTDHASHRLTVLCAGKLLPNQFERHLEPLERLDLVRKILVVRHAPLPERLHKLENLTFEDGGTLRNLARMALGVDAAMRRENVDWVLGFNPVPWGSLAALPALRRGARVLLSFIGKDFRQIMHPLAAPLRSVVRRATVVTVTGERMRRGLVELGVSESRIRTLPHFVDTERFQPGAAEPDFDVVSVGQLIHRKRMDVLIEAVARLRDRGISVRTAIVGEGALREELESLVRTRNLADRVEFLGFRDDVEAILNRARVFSLVSEWEGVPFALIEAMCSGLVPVVTDVGTIGDFVREEDNGHLVPVGDAAALAAALERLLVDRAHRDRLRRNVLALRNSLSLERGVAFWRELLTEST
jgi:glycosyltransferase involved in cell wall biosynthesis